MDLYLSYGSFLKTNKIYPDCLNCGYLYGLDSKCEGIIKIGYSQRLLQRLDAHNNSLEIFNTEINKVIIGGPYKNVLDLEALMKKYLKKSKLENMGKKYEWFYGSFKNVLECFDIIKDYPIHSLTNSDLR